MKDQYLHIMVLHYGVQVSTHNVGNGYSASYTINGALHTTSTTKTPQLAIDKARHELDIICYRA